MKFSRLICVFAFAFILFFSANTSLAGQSGNTDPAELSGELSIKQWAEKVLPEECRRPGRGDAADAYLDCADKYFSIYGQPVSPMIIHEMTALLSDTGDQIVAVDLAGSQKSNRFCCTSDIRIRKRDGRHTVYFETDPGEFGYSYIGRTDSGVHVLEIFEWGGGSGVFKCVMLLSLEKDQGIIFDEQSGFIEAARPRILLKKLGEVVLGDRWRGKLEVRENSLHIGRDEGWFADMESGSPFSKDPVDRIIKIDITPRTNMEVQAENP